MNAKVLPLTCLLLGALVFLTGCAHNKLEKRKQEKSEAYLGLSAEFQQMVDQGKIKVGMSTDAVYIAWGKPDQVYANESEQGTTVTWLYHGTNLESYRYWSYRTINGPKRAYTEPYLAQDYMVRSYVSAEVTFQNNVVKEWRTLPYPVY